MSLVIFNAFLYLLGLIFHWRKNHSFDTGFILWSVYTIIAVFCIFNYASNPAEWKGLTLLPFIYLFICCLLFFRTFNTSSDIIYQKLQIKNSFILNLFVLIYIIAASISIFYDIPRALLNLLSSEWNMVREDAYNDNVLMYNNQLERFAKIFIMYLKPLALILLFNFLTITSKIKNTQVFIYILLSISLVVPVFLTSTILASRGLILFFVLEFLCAFIIFRKHITKKNKRIVMFFGIIILLYIINFTLKVTFSRFSNSNSFESANSSLLYYFGHSMLTFNYGIFDSINKFMWGDFMFGSNANKYLMGFDYQLGTHFNTAFFTFIGGLFLDFGPIITVLISILFPSLLLNNFYNKKTIDIADFFIYFYFLTFLINGVFVVGRGYIIGWIMAFFIYIILKYIK